MIYLWSVLFGVLIGAACLAAAFVARLRPVTKLFGRPVQTERVMDVLVLIFILAVIFIRSYLIKGDWQQVLWKGIVAALCVLVPAVLVFTLGYTLFLRKTAPVKEEKE